MNELERHELEKAVAREEQEKRRLKNIEEFKKSRRASCESCPGCGRAGGRACSPVRTTCGW